MHWCQSLLIALGLFGATASDVAQAQLSPPVGASATASTNYLLHPPSGRVFTARDIYFPDYTNYVANLRAVGCPESKVRQIVLADVAELYDRRRSDEAKRWDFHWWQPGATLYDAGPWAVVVPSTLEQQRSNLIVRLLGTNVGEIAQLPAFSVGLKLCLTGPVLGSMPLDRYSTAATICAESAKRLQDYQNNRFIAAQQPDPVEEARLRDQTRAELGRVLSAEEMEEYLLRASHNAETLRQNLHGFDPSPEEFRKIFRALDPILHQIQIDYGGASALSTRQRQDLDRQCEQAVREILTPERFRDYTLLKDPAFQRAAAQARQARLAPEARRKLYEFYLTQETRAQQIKSDPALDDTKRAEALQALTAEEQRQLQDLQSQKAARKDAK